ncbi:MAG: hypothetical protein ACLFSQ_03960 [Candidatus Zixiibacteriota bacterium]
MKTERYFKTTKKIPLLSAFFWGSLFSVEILRLNIQAPDEIAIYSLLWIPLIFFVLFFVIGWLVGRPARLVLNRIYTILQIKHNCEHIKIDSHNSMVSVIATLFTLVYILSQTSGWIEYFGGYFKFAERISSLTLIYFIGFPLILYASLFLLLYKIFKYSSLFLEIILNSYSDFEDNTNNEGD